ncbi:hypothetical protein LIER_30681 [Lithospermum erythrorhizon]|uniref:CCHC-type domain-containing protein n=1 Tax=Lithospermum erythrorhizon TaxID=34254 RepID=A0AAV3RRP7_LITER
MDAEIIRELLGCKLTDEETTPVDLVEAELTEGLVGCEASMYVKVRGLKEKFLTREVVGKMENVFQGCDRIELRIDKQGKWFFRLKALVMVHMQLRRLVSFRVETEVVSCYLAYQRLPNMCFHCGRLGHLIRQCPDLEPDTDYKEAVVETIRDPQSKHFNPTVSGLPEDGPNMGQFKSLKYNYDGPSSTKEALQFLNFQSTTRLKSKPSGSGPRMQSKKRHRPYQVTFSSFPPSKKQSLSHEGLEVSNSQSGTMEAAPAECNEYSKLELSVGNQ